MLMPPDPRSRREHILVMGPQGAGKTTFWLNIARWAHATGSPARFFALDTEHAFEAFLGYGEEYADLHHENGGNVYPYEAYRWPQFMEFTDDVANKATREDFAIVDSISHPWPRVQDHYIDELFDDNKGNFFFEARKLANGGNPLDGWKDWGVINGLYFEFTDALANLPSHKFYTARSASIPPNADPGMRSLFGAYGVRPAGQKELGFLPHTVLLTTIVKQGEPRVTTIKDRQRVALDGKRIDQFTLDYLINIAGWSMS